MSETLPLSAERLRELYEAFYRTEVPKDWYRRHGQPYLDLLERAQRWSDEELRDATVQKELWESRAVGGIDRGNVNTRTVYTDRQVVDALVALRRRGWVPRTIWPDTSSDRCSAGGCTGICQSKRGCVVTHAAPSTTSRAA